MLTKKHILALFSATLMLTGASLAPVMAATTKNNIITLEEAKKDFLDEKNGKFELQDALLDFGLTWLNLLTEVNKKDIETQIKIIQEISNLHIGKVKNLQVKELRNIEIKLKALQAKDIPIDSERIYRFNFDTNLIPEISDEEIRKSGKFTPREDVMDEVTIMFFLVRNFVLTWKKLLTEIGKKTIQTQIDAIQKIGNLHIYESVIQEYYNFFEGKSLYNNYQENYQKLNDEFDYIVNKLKAIHVKISKNSK